MTTKIKKFIKPIIRLLPHMLLLGNSIIFSSLVFADIDNTTISSVNTSHTNISESDRSIQTTISASLPQYTNNLNVTVHNGVAYLSGQLNLIEDYEYAVAIARSSDGIYNVNVDNLTVKNISASLHDNYIAGIIKSSLLKSNILGKDFASWNVVIQVKDSNVYLSGTINSELEKRNVIFAVKTVNGIKKIYDHMVIRTENDMQDNSEEKE